MSDFSVTLTALQSRCNDALTARLPDPEAGPKRLHQAMRYACLNGGKRFRAVLVYAAGEAFGAPPAALDASAAAVEMIHAYSLVHDDLPAMDDDDLRRGKPTCHRAYDEATAILAGDALQTLAFEVLAEDPAPNADPSRRLRMIRTLAAATGSAGMAGGQSLDMEATRRTIDLNALQQIHRRKTGALIRASCLLGGLAAARTSVEDLDHLDDYGAALGLCFQIADDILDVTQESGVLGKSSGADERMHKATYVSLYGLEGARRECASQHALALETAERFGDNRVLFRQLADFVVNRSH